MAGGPSGAPRAPRKPRPAPKPSRPAKPRKPESEHPAATARTCALGALARVLDRGAALESALDGARGYHKLEPRDRAFARLLVATALRRAGELDAIIARLLEKPLPDGARLIHHILALGLVQLLYLGTPAHAAVATGVALADGGAKRRFKGLVNAVLRRAAREGMALTADLDAARVNTPDWLWESWSAHYGADATRRIAEMHLNEPPLDLTPREPATAPQLAARLEATVLPTGSLRRTAGGAIPDLPGYGEGAWWVQDAAAALPVKLLGEVRGKRVLDLCAAPGGKTLQLAAAGARVTAVDLNPGRLALITDNLARTGLAAERVADDGRAFTAAPFDAVLLDAPCTATGTLRRHPDIARTKGPDDVARTAALQDALLANAARLVRPGGTLVYAVCSLERAEGEDRITAFLAAHPDFAVDRVAPAEIGGLTEAVTEAGFLRTLPCQMAAEGGLDGFFAARLRRFGEAAT